MRRTVSSRPAGRAGADERPSRNATAQAPSAAPTARASESPPSRLERGQAGSTAGGGAGAADRGRGREAEARGAALPPRQTHCTSTGAQLQSDGGATSSGRNRRSTKTPPNAATRAQRATAGPGNCIARRSSARAHWFRAGRRIRPYWPRTAPTQRLSIPLCLQANDTRGVSIIILLFSHAE